MKALVKRVAAEGLRLDEVPVPEIGIRIDWHTIILNRSGTSGTVILEWSR